MSLYSSESSEPEGLWVIRSRHSQLAMLIRQNKVDARRSPKLQGQAGTRASWRRSAVPGKDKEVVAMTPSRRARIFQGMRHKAPWFVLKTDRLYSKPKPHHEPFLFSCELLMS